MERGDVDAIAGSTPADGAHLPRLTSLRGFAALYVFGYHLQFFAVVGTVPLLGLGYTGVAFFFMLSGFVLAWGADPGEARRKFWFRRFARIYPAYVVVLVCAGALSPPGTPHRSVVGGLASALLVQSWSAHNPGIVYALNPPSWSLSNEAFFYLALPFILPVLTAMRARPRRVVGGGWFLLTCAVVALAAHQGDSWRFVAFTFPLVRSGEFLVGVLAAIELRQGRRLSARSGAALGAVGVLLAAVLPRTTPLPDLWLDPLWLAIIVLAAQADLAGRRGWLLTRRWTVYAGGVSFAFYLVHQDVLVETARLLGRGPAGAVACLLAAAVVAVVVHHTVERPARRLLISRLGPLVAREPVLPPLVPDGLEVG